MWLASRHIHPDNVQCVGDKTSLLSCSRLGNIAAVND